jgi:uncharacterized repeat protein (TIGR03803 family)
MQNIIRGLVRRLGVAGLAVVSVAGGVLAQPVETVLYSFKGGTDGASPFAGLIADAQGALYGTTEGAIGGGGTLGCPIGGSCGTVFKLTPPANGQTNWTETVLYGFTGGTDGANPNASLIADKNGALYSTTEYGGSGTCPINNSGCGMVFKLTPPATGQTAWTETVLYSFQGFNGRSSRPESGLIFDAAEANLYGTTTQGGSSGCGTVFKLTAPATGQSAWTETVLFSFQCGSDGFDLKASLIADKNGALYSTTEYGGSSTCLFFGTINSGCGTVFKLTPPATGQTAWTETVLYSFQGNPSEGAFPIGGLIADKNGALYGTTFGGGSSGGCSGNSCGTVFKLTPPAAGQTAWTETVLHSFTGGSDGAEPVAGLVADAQGALYSSTMEFYGNSGFFGTVFKVMPPATGQTAWTETVLYKFCSLSNCTDGKYPTAGLIGGLDGAAYGTTTSGGSCGASGGCGTVFKLQ